MFTVKATYRGETRKFSCSDDTFPTFEQLCDQLYRVFPISHNYYLYKLLFSPNVAQGSRILIGREVRTLDDYDKSIAPHRGRVWPHGLLRFSVYDETSHKAPNASQGFITAGSRPCSSYTSVAGPSSVITPLSASHIPQPPITYSTPSIAGTMEVDSGSEASKGKSVTPQSCCSVQTAKQDIQKLIVDFKHDLDDILAGFTIKQTVAQSPPLTVLSAFPPSTSIGHNSSSYTGTPGNSPLCSSCAQSKQSSWAVCDRCHVVECIDCSGKTLSFCFGTMGTHQWRQNATLPAVTPWFTTQLPGHMSSTADSSVSMPWTASTGTRSPFNRSAATPTAPFVPPPMTPMIPEETVADNTPQARAVVHHGVFCDGCESTIQGARHKCLDCPDYDLCTNCLLSGGTERHNPFHEFFEITEPGRVIVHRVHERPSNAELDRNVVQEPVGTVSHHATCDLCDSHIEGDRYKCLDCPDFDTCSVCFRITEIQHPGHCFARLQHSDDYIKRRRSNFSAHYATCNICTKRIYGVRFKCMHHDCPDFDLCDVCEAHPIPLHPESHPLLKMKIPDGVIPEVCRHELSPLLDLGAGDTRHSAPDVIPHGDHQFAVPIPPEPTQNPFVWGYMRAPLSDESSPQTPVVQPTLVPRLDEISPSIIRAPFHGDRPLLVQAENADQNNASPIPAPSRETRAEGPLVTRGDVLSPTRVHQDDDDVSRGRPTWPGTATELAHLMASVSQSRSRSDSSVQGQDRSDITFGAFPAPSPVSGEETLLNAPAEDTSSNMQQKSIQPVTVSRQTLAMLLGGYQSPSSVDSLSSVASPESPNLASSSPDVRTAEVDKLQSDVNTPTVAGRIQDERKDGNFVPSSTEQAQQPASKEKCDPPIKEVEVKVYLSAMFAEDVTVADGQIFPPGAEFMKCWRMLNDSEYDWPEATELVYVAGETFDTKKDGAVHVGVVRSGTEVELWTGELKAPDVAGRYVSYWRLRDGDGVLFGDSIWIDIVVADAHSSDESDKSIASSLVIMPQSVHASTPERSSKEGTSIVEDRSQTLGQATRTLTNGTASARSLTIGTISLPSSSSVDGIGSDTDSETSLVSIPSSGDGELWEDIGSSAGHATRDMNGQTRDQASDYVLLYDDRSSEDE